MIQWNANGMQYLTGDERVAAQAILDDGPYESLGMTKGGELRVVLRDSWIDVVLLIKHEEIPRIVGYAILENN